MRLPPSSWPHAGRRGSGAALAVVVDVPDAAVVDVYGPGIATGKGRARQKDMPRPGVGYTRPLESRPLCKFGRDFQSVDNPTAALLNPRWPWAGDSRQGDSLLQQVLGQTVSLGIIGPWCSRRTQSTTWSANLFVYARLFSRSRSRIPAAVNQRLPAAGFQTPTCLARTRK